MTRQAVIVHVHNAFRPERARQVYPLAETCTVRGWLNTRGIAEFSVPTLCLLNDRPVLRAAWKHTVIRPGDVCVFLALPGRGGGGGRGKNPLRTILMVATMIVAPYAGAGLAGLMGVTSAIGVSLITAGVALTSTALLNVLVPPPKPSATPFTGNGTADLPTPSPTYSLHGQGNSARPGQVIPVQYGRHRLFPDLLTAEAWGEFHDNEQYLYQAHCLGLGTYDVEKIQIGDSDIAGFAEITHQIIEPGQPLTLFDVNVMTRHEVSGQELKGSNEHKDDGFIGPFVLNPVDTVATHVGIDVVMPRGLYYATNSGSLAQKKVTWTVQAQQLDDTDQPVGSWVTLGTENHSAAQATPIRLSFRYELTPKGRYHIRLKRTDTRDTSSRAGHELRWMGLKAFVEGPDRYKDITILMVKMRATDNLSQRMARTVSVIQTRRLSVWDAATRAWLPPQACRSIVWAAVDICRASWGAALTDARLPLDELSALDTILSERGDTFDGVFDSKTTVWEALTRIVRCGRAVPILQNGTVRLVRDGVQSLPVAMFGPRNIVKGSFRVSWRMPDEDTADAVTVEYFSARTWKPADVTGTVPGARAETPVTVSLFGCVSQAHAQREADYMAAANRYRRRMVTFRTELEGMIPTYGDLIAVTHDMPRWGQGGEVIDWDAKANLLVVSEPLVWEEDASHVIALRRRDGSLAGPFACRAGSDPDHVVVEETVSITPNMHPSEERTLFSFGPRDMWSQLCRVLSVRPRNGGEQVEITAVTEDPRVHVN